MGLFFKPYKTLQIIVFKMTVSGRVRKNTNSNKCCVIFSSKLSNYGFNCDVPTSDMVSIFGYKCCG